MRMKNSKEYSKVRTKNKHQSSRDPKTSPTKASDRVEEMVVQGQIQLKLKEDKLTRSPDYPKASIQSLKTSAAGTTLNQIQNKDAKSMYMDHTKHKIAGTHVVTMKKRITK